jgi:Flp pilus assembly pilin Flp
MDTINLAMTRTYLAMAAAVEWMVTLFAPQTRLATVSRSRRGAGMIEYALLAALAVGLFLVVRATLNGKIGGKFTDILNEIGVSSE